MQIANMWVAFRSEALNVRGENVLAYWILHCRAEWILRLEYSAVAALYADARRSLTLRLFTKICHQTPAKRVTRKF